LTPSWGQVQQQRGHYPSCSHSPNQEVAAASWEPPGPLVLLEFHRSNRNATDTSATANEYISLDAFLPNQVSGILALQGLEISGNVKKN